MTRKTPIKHKVSGYSRKNGIKVSSYDRGKGIRVRNTRRKKTVAEESTKIDDKGIVILTKPKPFTINFTYSDKPRDGESVVVIVGKQGIPLGEAYELALDEAYEEKTDPRPPIDIELVDPSLGAVLQFIGKGAKKVGSLSLKGIKKLGRTGVKGVKIGAKYAIRGGHVAKQVAVATGKAGVSALRHTAKTALFEIQRKRVQQMLKAAYSRDITVRNTSRWALKKYYPSIFDICDFSKDRNIAWRNPPKVGVLRPKKVVRGSNP